LSEINRYDALAMVTTSPARPPQLDLAQGASQL
jgi:hypothetical protein